MLIHLSLFLVCVAVGQVSGPWRSIGNLTSVYILYSLVLLSCSYHELCSVGFALLAGIVGVGDAVAPKTLVAVGDQPSCPANSNH